MLLDIQSVSQILVKQLVYILTALEYSGFKLDFTVSLLSLATFAYLIGTDPTQHAPVPVGRNASGCAQRFGRLKKALQKDMDALKNGMPVPKPRASAKPRVVRLTRHPRSAVAVVPRRSMSLSPSPSLSLQSSRRLRPSLRKWVALKRSSRRFDDVA